MMAATAPFQGRWRVAAHARPLVCWGDAQVRALAQALEQALAAWAADWGVQVAGSVTSQAADLSDASLAWRPLQMGAEPAGWLHVPAETAAGLTLLLFPAVVAAGPVAASAASACEQDAVHRLFATLGVAASTAPAPRPRPDDIRPWSGAVQVQLPAPLGWRFLLQATAMAAWCRRHGAMGASRPPPPHLPLASVIDAASALPVSLEVQLAGCELDLAALQRLQPGDVLRMQHRIDAPAAVVDRAGTPLFAAYLGRRAGSRAVELAPLGSPQIHPPSHEDQP